MTKQGADFWPLKLARELDDAILDIRTNELEIAVIVFKSEGEIEQVLAYDAFLDANKANWLAREIRHAVEARAQAHRPDLAQSRRRYRARLLLCRHARRNRSSPATAPTC